MFGKREEPTASEVHEQRKPSNAEVSTRNKTVSNSGLTGASALTLKQSILPITLVTILFFLWGFAYGLLDVLNAKFQTALNITAAKAGGQSPFLAFILESQAADLFDSNRSTSRIFRRLLHRPFDIFWLDRPKVRVQMDLHHRPLPLWRWCVDVLALCRIQVLRRILWKPVHRWQWTKHTGNIGKPFHCNLRTSSTL